MSGPATISIESQQVCTAIVRSRAKHFYYGLALTPQPKRMAIFAIYAWMRQVDDIVDEPMDQSARLIAFNTFSEQTFRALDGQAVSDPVLEGVVFAQRKYGLRREIFASMLDAMQMDLHGVHIDSFPAYDRYCQGVAVSAGEAACTIWGIRPGFHKQAMSLIHDAGLAFQTTNILRDLTEDARLRRVYIPADLLAQHDLDEAGFFAITRPQACLAVLNHLIDRAQQQYRRAQGLLDLIEPPCSAAYFGMHTMYQRVLNLVARDPLAALRGHRVSIGKGAKLAIAGRALLKSWTEGR